MLSERDIDLAHPDAFDFVFGTLGSAKSVWFNSHLDGCRHCQKVVAEHSDIGRIIQNLPPHVEPPADLEDRTVAAMAAARADRRAKPDRRSRDDAGVFPTLAKPDRPSGDEDQASPGSTRRRSWRSGLSREGRCVPHCRSTTQPSHPCSTRFPPIGPLLLYRLRSDSQYEGAAPKKAPPTERTDPLPGSVSEALMATE